MKDNTTLYIRCADHAEQLALRRVLKEKGYTLANGQEINDHTLPMTATPDGEIVYPFPYAVNPERRTLAYLSAMTAGTLPRITNRPVIDFSALEQERL